MIKSNSILDINNLTQILNEKTYLFITIAFIIM